MTAGSHNSALWERGSVNIHPKPTPSTCVMIKRYIPHGGPKS
jgi:hypothetical protein